MCAKKLTREMRVTAAVDAVLNGDKTLDFNEFHWNHRIPDEIRSCAWLETMMLCVNPLDELREWIGELENLKEPNLYTCKLQRLPESIGNLSNLQILDLTNSTLGQLPDSFRRLSKLKRLELSVCELTELPEWIGELRIWNHLNWA